MIRILSFLFFSINGFMGFGQILNQKEIIYNETPFFNSEWIKTNHIKRIKARVSIKKDNHPIQQTDNIQSYNFDKEGRLMMQAESEHHSSRKDTLEILYQYGKGDEWERKIVKDHYGYYAIIKKFDSEGVLKRVTHARMQRMLGNVFKHEKVIWSDSIVSSNQSENMQRRIHFNSVGKPYKEVLIKFNKRREQIQVNVNYKIGGRSEFQSIKRDEKGNIQKLIKRESTWKNDLKSVYSFNNIGQVIKEEQYSGDEMIALRKLQYDKQGRLTLHLYREIQNKKMMIYEYDYVYY